MVSFDAVSLILAGIRTLARGPLRFSFFWRSVYISPRCHHHQYFLWFAAHSDHVNKLINHIYGPAVVVS